MLEAGVLFLSLGAGNIHEQLEILAADLVIAEKLKAIVAKRVRSPLRAAVEPYDPARWRSRTVLGRAAHRTDLRGTDSLLPR